MLSVIQSLDPRDFLGAQVGLQYAQSLSQGGFLGELGFLHRLAYF